MKVWNYVFIITFIAILFELAGIPVAEELLSYLGISITEGLSIKTASLYLAIFGGSGVLIGIVASVVIGTFVRNSPENYVLLPLIVSSLTLFASTWVGIVNSARAIGGWVFYITLLIISPLAVGYIFSLAEFFRGTD